MTQQSPYSLIDTSHLTHLISVIRPDESKNDQKWQKKPPNLTPDLGPVLHSSVAASFRSFSVIHLKPTDQQTDVGENITSFAEVMIKWSKPSLNLFLLMDNSCYKSLRCSVETPEVMWLLAGSRRLATGFLSSLTCLFVCVVFM